MSSRLFWKCGFHGLCCGRCHNKTRAFAQNALGRHHRPTSIPPPRRECIRTNTTADPVFSAMACAPLPWSMPFSWVHVRPAQEPPSAVPALLASREEQGQRSISQLQGVERWIDAVGCRSEAVCSRKAFFSSGVSCVLVGIGYRAIDAGRQGRDAWPAARNLRKRVKATRPRHPSNSRRRDAEGLLKSALKTPVQIAKRRGPRLSASTL